MRGGSPQLGLLGGGRRGCRRRARSYIVVDQVQAQEGGVRPRDARGRERRGGWLGLPPAAASTASARSCCSNQEPSPGSCQGRGASSTSPVESLAPASASAPCCPSPSSTWSLEGRPPGLRVGRRRSWGWGRGGATSGGELPAPVEAAGKESRRLLVREPQAVLHEGEDKAAGINLSCCSSIKFNSIMGAMSPSKQP